MQRFFLALHATTPAALTVAVFVHLWGPAGLPSLAQRPVWAVWVLVGAWLLMSVAAAWALRALALWRVALCGAGAMLAVAGTVGLVLGSAQALGMGASLVAVGLACAGIAAFIGPQRVQAHRRKPARHTAVATSGTAAHPIAPRPRWHPRGWPRCGVPAHLPFWLSGLLALESFRLAHIVATEPARSSGMLGLLLAFFVALPAATLRHWAPRATALLWALAALAYGGLAAKAGLAQWAVASVLCALAAGAPLLLLRVRRALRWRRAGHGARHKPAPAPDHRPPEAA